MKPIPSKRIPAFTKWLVQGGAEILAPTNEWEVLRFRASGKVSVIYKNAQGALNFAACDSSAINAFMNGIGWTAGHAKDRKPRKSADVRALLARDGDCCFLCGFPMEDDITIEHLVPLVNGGPNHIANMALTHQRCNEILGHKSLMEKIKLREHHQDWSAKQ